MLIEYDAEKSARNEEVRGLPFGMVEDFDWDSAMVVEDTRRDYGERRFQAIGLLGERLHVVVFTSIPGGIRIISLRKANHREMNHYDKAAPRT
ncbi:MAG: BrnT family toxin [Casimicrobiaceae bacterium]